MSLHEVVVLGLITCGEVGLVIGLHLLFGEVRSVTTALKVVEEVQEGLQLKENEKKRKLDGMESSKSKSDAHCTHGSRLCEEAVLGLITCVGEGLVSRPHLLGEVNKGLNLGEVEG